jgi:hypothetical protein
MAKPQITVRLASSVKTEFEAYAAQLGLDTSELAKLLIVRERNLKRLAALKNANEIPTRRRQQYGSRTRFPTVTAHFSTRTPVEEFDAYAKSCGLNRSGAGAWLLEMELREKWLKDALARG